MGETKLLVERKIKCNGTFCGDCKHHHAWGRKRHLIHTCDLFLTRSGDERKLRLSDPCDECYPLDDDVLRCAQCLTAADQYKKHGGSLLDRVKKAHWKYCECGCHCSSAKINSRWFTIYYTLGKANKIYLWEGGCRSKLRNPDVICKTHKEMDQAIVKMLKEFEAEK